MALEGCSACLKYLMIVWNFIILLFGIAIVGVGIWLAVDKTSGEYVDDLAADSNFVISYSRVSDDQLFQVLAYILIAFGAVVVFISFLGYCGAIRESQCLLAACFICLFLIFGALLAVGIYIFVKRDEIDVDQDKLAPIVKEMLNKAVENYDTDPPSKKFMDTIQAKFDCCGAENGFKDYKFGIVDKCALSDYGNPCYPPYFNYVQENIGIKQFFSGKMTVATAVALGVAGSLILAMILTLILCTAVRRSTVVIN